MPRLMTVMQMLILLLLPTVVSGGFDVCPVHHEIGEWWQGGCCVHSSVGCGESSEQLCSHRHRHERIRLLTDAGLRMQKGNRMIPAAMLQQKFGQAVAFRLPYSYSFVPLAFRRWSLPWCHCLVLPLKC